MIYLFITLVILLVVCGEIRIRSNLRKALLSIIPDKEKPMLPVPSSDQWREVDVINLRSFQGTETGRKFFALSGQKIFNDSLEAFKDVMHTAHSAGTIAGADDLLRWQFNLASDVVAKKISEATAVKVAKTGLNKSELSSETIRSF